MAMLLAQRKQQRSLALSVWKEEGVPYEERMELLEKIEWHQPPNRDSIEALYAEYQTQKPYLGEDLLQTKSITRYLLELNLSLTDFIREFGLKRSEGLVLRYVSQSLKYLRQNLPSELVTEALSDYISQLESIVRGVDTSFLALSDKSTSEDAVERQSRLSDQDVRRHVRSVMQMAMKAWQAGRMDTLESILEPPTDGSASTEEWFKKMSSVYEVTHGSFRISPAMQDQAALTLSAEHPHQWRVTQFLGTDHDDEDWFLWGTVNIDNHKGEQITIHAEAISAKLV